MQGRGGGLQIEGFDVYGWSIAGNETAIGVKAGKHFFVFDMGIAPFWSKNATHVFISHGHIDHIGAICQHMKKQALNDLPPARYHLNPDLVPYIETLFHAYSVMQGSPLNRSFDPVFTATYPGSAYDLDRNWKVDCFATDHAVQSQGYILSLKDKSTGEYIPQIAYTGDTRFSIFTKPAHPNLLKVKLLICESTYLTDEGKTPENADLYGHIRLSQIAENADLFRNVGALFLMHFSDRYSFSQIKQLVYNRLPPQLAVKTYLSLAAKKSQNNEQNTYTDVCFEDSWFSGRDVFFMWDTRAQPVIITR